MFDLFDFEELHCFNCSELIIEKFEEASSFARVKGFASGKPSQININSDMVTAYIHLSYSLHFLNHIKKNYIIPSFSIDEISFIKGSEPLVERIEEVSVFLKEKGYFFEISPSCLGIDGKTLTASFSLKLSFRLPSLQPLISSRLSSLQNPYKPKQVAI